MQDIFANLTHEQLKQAREIGYQLREARENLKYTLDYVVEVTRIPVHSIQQLEEGNFGALENVVFLKGFLRNYCHFIQLDSTPFFETINRFISQTTPDAVSDTTQSSHTNSSFLTKDKDIWQRPFLRNLVLAALVVVLVTMVIYFLFFFNFAQKEQVKLQNVKKNAVQTQEITSTPETDSLVLSIIAKKDGWARISSNKNRTFEIFLKEEVKYRWNVKEDFSIILSIADLAEVLLNDKKIQNVISNSGLLFLDINSFASKN